MTIFHLIFILVLFSRSYTKTAQEKKHGSQKEFWLSKDTTSLPKVQTGQFPIGAGAQTTAISNNYKHL